MTQLTPGPNGGVPEAVAIGDLHDTTAGSIARNPALCSGLWVALPGCRNDVAVLGGLGYGTVFLKDAKDNGLTGMGPFDIASVPELPTSVGIGDFNGDGINDLAISGADATNDAIYIYDGTGAGNFASGYSQFIPIDVPAADGPGGAVVSSLAVGDFGNGHADIAVTVGGSPDGQLVVLMNDGHGNFTQTVYPAPDAATQVVVGDLGNGRPDLAVANAGDPLNASVELYMNKGRGVFTPQTPIALPWPLLPYSIAIGDFTPNGLPDLVTANIGDPAHDGANSVTVFENNGRDGYTLQTIPDAHQSNGNDQPGQIATGDFNGNGLDDFVITNGGANSITVFMTDYSHDGPSWTQTTLATDPAPYDVAVGHVNSPDGAQDIVVGDEYGQADLFTNTTRQLG